MTGGVVLLEQVALGAQVDAEVRRAGVGAEGLVVALVLEDDDEDVLDRWQLRS